MSAASEPETTQAERAPPANALPAPLPDAPAALAARALGGDVRALARALSWVEQGGTRAAALLDAVYPSVGQAHRIGITGPPGAGKSTLTAALAQGIRREGRTCGIVCVDPTSPFSGGALLGDRIRMAAVSEDPGVFIRSMATRGSLGGLSRRTGEVCDVLDAAGRAVVLIETVGVGQSEVEIASAADTTVVVLSPEGGDAVQAMKAGLMEIADIFCVNKADRPGADKMARAIEAMLELGDGAAPWRPPVVLTTAHAGEGVDALWDAIGRHRTHLEATGDKARRRRERAGQALRAHLRERLWEDLLARIGGDGPILAATDEVADGRTTPRRAAERLAAGQAAPPGA